MSAPNPVRQSDLAWKDGPFAAGGWLEVDKDHRLPIERLRLPRHTGD